MALTSPGVEVKVIDESYYTPAEPGTVPLIVVATAQDKQNASGTGTAQGTTKANAGKAFRVTSQRDLVDLFGVPSFARTASGSPVHGGEQNEYGLQAAYSLMGVTNSAYIVRADIDLDQITAAADAPGSNPADGQWWLDTQNSLFGIFEWNGDAASAGGQKFTNKTPIVLTADDSAKIAPSGAPKSSVGVAGDYAVVAESGTIRVYFNKKVISNAGAVSTEWVVVGSNDWTSAWPTIVGSAITTSVSGTVSINNTTVTNSGNLSSWATAINNLAIQGVTAKVISNKLHIYSDSTSSSVPGDGDSSTGDGGVTIENGPLVGIGTSAAATSYQCPLLTMSPHTTVPAYKRTNPAPRPTGSIWVKTTDPNLGARWRVKRWNATTEAWVEQSAPLYATPHAAIYGLDKSRGGAAIPTNTVFVQYNYEEESGYDTSPQTATFKLFNRVNAGAATSITTSVGISARGAGDVMVVRESLQGSATLSSPVTITFGAFTGNQDDDADAFATAVNNAGLVNVSASVANGKVILSHKLGGEIRILDSDGVLSAIGFVAYTGTNAALATPHLYTAPPGEAYDYIASNWKPLAMIGYVAANDPPLDEPVDGQLWYSSRVSEVDMMVHDGSTWVGYHTEYPNTDPAGPIVAATKPTTQSDGSVLVDGDLWVSTADMENFPQIYRYSGDFQKFILLDKSDQVSEDGVLFADARWSIDGTSKEPSTIVELLTSNHLDPDAPDPALYPSGMLLWNMRRSGFNVKKYVNNYIDLEADNPRMGDASMASYWSDRWVSESGTNEDGSGCFGRQAQRKVVVARLKSVVDTSAEIREEELRNFNLIAAPGYPELLSNLINLNIDRGTTAFVVGDTPLRLKADATSLTNWGGNVAGALDNNDKGVVSYDEYAALFYPNGFTTDNNGNNIVVPASHMMLKTITLSDQVSYPWFAPAGTRRGGITNATAVGYIDATSGEFQQVALNEGQRDTLYEIKVNPITFFNGVGLVNYGQKTRAKNASSLDRINVARLVAYLRSQLNKLAKPYVFEPNDKITRDEVKQAVESLLLELVSLRAIYDFAVVCDETNNTPARIDRNELYVDIAIEPVKAIEFIYIPLRLLNTGEISSGG